MVFPKDFTELLRQTLMDQPHNEASIALSALRNNERGRLLSALESLKNKHYSSEEILLLFATGDEKKIRELAELAEACGRLLSEANKFYQQHQAKSNTPPMIDLR